MSGPRGLAAEARNGPPRALLAAGATSTMLVCVLGVTGCGLLFPAPPASPASGEGPSTGLLPSPGPGGLESAEELPAGLGTLRQEEISITLRRGDLLVRVTPLDESIILVTAPDTHERLSALARGHQEIFRERTGSAVPFQLFLVSLYTEALDQTFEPEALSLVNRGLRHRPAAIRPLTPEWDTRRLTPRQALMAIYAFPLDVDLERELEVEYQEIRSRDWDRILPQIEAERARVRARIPIPN
jgi:hypothetical protein